MTPASDDLLLAIDCGTQSVRALLIDLGETSWPSGSGRSTATSRRKAAGSSTTPRRSGRQPHPSAGISGPRARSSGCGRRGVVVTAQRGSLTLVDDRGRPLRPFIIWLDQRRARRTPPLPPWWRAAFLAAGASGAIDYLARESELNWIAEHEPERLARTHKVLLVSGWLNYRLTGRFADSAGSQVGYIPFDYKRHDWARAWDWRWSALAARREQMPDLVPVGAVIGP